MARPGARGWPGRGGGSASYVQAPDEWRGTTVQVCGLWPFAAGTGSPMVGVPVGRNLVSGATVGADPISWFQRARLIHTPSMFVLGNVGRGKSTLVRRMALGLAGYGVLPMVLGDLKPDYVDLIRAMGGQVIELGRGRGRLNILDPGEAIAAADRLTGQARSQLLDDAHGRRHTMVATLVTLVRAAPPSDHEETLLDHAIRRLEERHDGVPILADLIRVLVEAPDELREVAYDRGDLDRYRDATDPLVKTLTGLLSKGRIGEMFSTHTTTAMRRDRPVVFDISSINNENDVALKRAALIACWSYGFGSINVANALADAGLEPPRHRFCVIDELWQALRGGRGMVDRVDALTRLNRQHGVGTAMISHTMSDLEALPDEDDRMKARGFVERSGMVVCAGLPEGEMAMLTRAVPLSRAERDLLVSWQDPAVWDDDAQSAGLPPGLGNFLIKVGGRPGIPVHVALTDAEEALNDTNKRWHARSRLADVDELAAEPAA